MATEYKLSYTATDINARLGKINQLSENVADLQDNINAVQGNVEQVQSNLEQHNISTTAHADIRTEITTATSNLKEELLDGASTEYNTFKKLGELINNNASNIDQLTDNKQNVITGATGQIVGFDENGNAVAKNNPQPDWNQNDENAPDYVKNRTHYDYEGIEELLPTTSVTISNNGSGGCYKNFPFETIPLIVGDPYIVTYDDVEYNVVAYTAGSFTCIGNPGGITGNNMYGTGEIPFVYVMADDDTTLFGTATTHTIAIKHQGIISATIPDKYISKEIARTSKTLTNNNPSGTGSFSLNRKSGDPIGTQSVAIGSNTVASGRASYAEGSGTQAKKDYSHAEGQSTIAGSAHQHAQGKYNIEDSSNTYAHIVGNGTLNTARSNAHTLDWDGNAWFQGDVYVGSTSGINKDEGSVKLQKEITGTQGQVVGFDANGNPIAQDPASSMPDVTTSDNGKFLRVVDGAWAASTVPNAEEVAF